MYCVGNTLDDDRDLYGRDALIEELYSGRDRRVLLLGMRRTGKSSILLALERRALAGDRYIPIRIAPEGTQSLSQVRDDFANAISRRRKMLVGLPGNFLKLRKLDLDVLLRVAEEAAEDANRSLMLLVDEADALARVAETEPALAMRVRAGLPEGDGTRVIVTGSRRALRLKYDRIGEGEPLLGGFATLTLAPTLDPESAARLIRLDRRQGVGKANFAPADVDAVISKTGGHPYLTQALCAYAKQFDKNPKDALDVVLTSNESKDAFLQDLERISPSERRVLQALIGGKEPSGDLAPFVRSLVEIGLLDGTGALAVPAMGPFMEQVGWDARPSRLSDTVAASEMTVEPEYVPVRVLGSGGFGEVVLVEQYAAEGVRRLVAVKLLHVKHAGNTRLEGTLRDEARMLALIRHRSIVRAEAIVQLHGRLGIVMEYVPGVDLNAVIEAVPHIGPMPEAAVAAIVADVADALHVAWHRIPPGESEPFRVLHRDIKPHNIRLTQDGEFKVLDFGIASASFAGQEAQVRLEVGTPAYMAPERSRGIHDNPASDVYSLGAVGAELMGDQQSTTLPNLSDLLTEMMADDLYARPSAKEVAVRARRLAQKIPGMDLRAWTAQHVPILEAHPYEMASTASQSTMGGLGADFDSIESVDDPDSVTWSAE